MKWPISAFGSLKFLNELLLCEMEMANNEQQKKTVWYKAATYLESVKIIVNGNIIIITMVILL